MPGLASCLLHPPPPSCGTFGMLVNRSGPQFPQSDMDITAPIAHG